VIINIQCHPTPIQWLERKPNPPPFEILGGTGTFLGAAWDYMLVENLSTNTETAGARGGDCSFANGDSNINSPSQSDSSTSLAAAPTFAWDGVIVVSAQSESVNAAGSSLPVFSWDAVVVTGDGQSEAAGALAAVDPTFNNG
jgi:hypothetical protein